MTAIDKPETKNHWHTWLDAHPSYAIHVLEHESGQGMGLAHHPQCTNYVMESVPCNGWWLQGSDIGTARCVYIYAC